MITAPPSSPVLPPDALPVALGRHALALVARQLRARGIHQVTLPDFHCLTMLAPFQLEGMHVAHVRTGADLMADPEDLSRVVSADPPSWAVLHCETFGARPSPDLAGILARAQEQGATLVVDATHSWPDPPGIEGAHRVASVRKLTGLPDGAFATGLDPRHLPDLTRSATDEAETAAWMSGDTEDAEDLMEVELSPAAMSAISLRLLARIDLAALVAGRRRRGAALAGGLRELGLDVVSPPGAHFCVAFRHPRGPELVLALARLGVDGPVWWPRPRGWVRDWPDDVVTLPLGPAGWGDSTGPVGWADSPGRAGSTGTTDSAGRAGSVDEGGAFGPAVRPDGNDTPDGQVAGLLELVRRVLTRP